MESITLAQSTPSLTRRAVPSTPAPIARLLSLRVRVLIIATVVSALLQQGSQAVLNVFYENSGYPVPFFVGQLSFDANKLEGWYGQMLSNGTLGVYWQTQIVDFGFIASTILLHASALALVARLLPAATRWRRFATAMIVVGVSAPIFDVLENLVSFVLLQNPLEVSQPLAVLYSSFAALKFLGFLLAYAWVSVGLIAAAVIAVRAKRA
jgi:hypothetical protein